MNSQITKYIYSSHFLLMFAHFVIQHRRFRGAGRSSTWLDVSQLVSLTSLPAELFVDAWVLMMAPQFASYRHWDTTCCTGDPTTIVNAVRNSVSEVAATTVQFPAVVTRDVTD